MDSMAEEFVAAIWPLIVIQKAKFCNLLKHKLKNVNQSYGKTLGITIKLNIRVRSAHDGLTLLVYVTEGI
jgi:hypothetical protein